MSFWQRKKASASASTTTEPPKELYGLFSLHEIPNADADVDIVAVHGLGGHFEGTWTDSDSKKLWLRDFLPSQLKEAGVTARILSYGYDSTTAFSKSVTDIEDQATMLLDTLALERLSPAEKNRPLIFIAHSLGGIIVKKALIIAHERSSHYKLVLSSTHALVFFGVPHRGSDLAYWSKVAARLSKTFQLGLGTNTSFVKALEKNSQTFADISMSFIERATPLQIRTFYETEKLYGHLIVDKDSARLGLPNELSVGVMAAHHGTICKYNRWDSQRYRPVWKAIQTLVVDIKASTPTMIQQASLFIVPFSRDPLFLGREDIIELVDTKFKSESRVALTGIGGVGKSQVAIEYCYRFRDSHPDWNIFWVHAGTKERFEQAFKAIARNRNLSGWDDPAKNPLDLVYDWLSTDTTWLMIIDNADDKDVFFDQRPTIVSQSPESQRTTLPLVSYLPQRSSGALMLITSRNRDAAFRLTNSVERLIDVPYMGKEDAVALLCKKLPDDQSSDTEKFELVDLLERLPLAITQAASYISVKRTRMSIARYSTLLRKNGDILLGDMGDLRRDSNIPSSVLLTWHISFDQINGENHPAAELLSLMSVFDRQGIPQNLLQSEDEDDLDFENRLAPLQEFSLIIAEDSGQSFQMHRLVQMAIRSWLERHGGIDRWKRDGIKLIADSLPTVEYRFWKTWEILLPHSEVALNYVLPSQDSQLLHAKILATTAQYFMVRGKYDAAKERGQRALDIELNLLGEDNVEVAFSLVFLARLKRLTEFDRPLEIEESEAMVRRALDIFEYVQEKDSNDSMYARNELALILSDSGHEQKIEEATEILQSVLACREQRLGLEHSDTLTTMNNLAVDFKNQHEYDEAEKLHRETLEVLLRVHGEKDLLTLGSMQNLSHSLIRLERYEEAQKLAQRALDSRMEVLGDEHPSTFESMTILAYVLHRQGQNQKAEGLFHKVYKRRPGWWGDRYWDIFLADFAETLARVGKHDEAAEISRQRVPSRRCRS